MKEMFKNISLLIAALVITSCNNLLDVTPQGPPTSNSFWKTQEDAIAGVNAIYDLYSDDDMYGRGFFWLNNASDDIGTKPRANAERIKNFQVDGNESDTKNIWAKHYQVMKRCNDAIRNIPAITFRDEKLKNRLLGEAYFNHAVMHLELAYRYGDSRAGIPIQNREDPEDIYVSRTQNVSENYAYIIADLKKAAALLPNFSQYATTDYGRAHKSAAWAYLVRTYLYAKEWANAESYADTVINSGQHNLLKEFADVFKTANNWSKEYIWSVSSSVSNTSKGCIFPGVVLEDKGWGFYNGWGNFYPTKELFDTYDKDDKRLPATILKTGDTFMFFGEERVFNVGKFTVSSSNRTGYQFKKYMEPFGYANPVGTYVNPNGDKPSTTLNVPLLRYADIILMKAEALLMQNKSADTEINMIRNRAGLESISNATMKDLKRERRCEFAGEWTDRHWDLVRWGDAEATYAKPLHHADGKVIYEGRTFKPTVHHVWPIPPDEIAVSKGALWQNEGY
ncbi:RagB/SusD family nutrient uptake outer membrane protein [Cytophagaceae bacterium DM2B3-1]|uniref:RagB/SusD family nutrient uptake outer membrane protein n=1 Tax=Xanthocytophaga flava TaxID=3048013 RepID=A0ABT7CGC5_9BACT|nr:RagB/SusD family nutrient uptake outer membrane protein [Xanthocytophaga flavus]MDJ1492795.1 RagB/SusD family nutrient uptake outer membrane protein [Xanthocytophaga flavus]